MEEFEKGPRFQSKDNLVRFSDSMAKPGRLQTMVQNIDKVFDWTFSGDGIRDFRGVSEALIVADTETSPVTYNLMAGMLPKFGVNPTVLTLPQRDRPNAPVSKTVLAAAEQTDLIINLATYTISHPLAVEGLLETTEYLLIADATEDRFCRGAIDADPAVVDRLTRAVAEKFECGSTVHMTADNGTDLEIPIDRASGSASGFPHNEAKPRPLPMEEINGTVVQDSFIMLVGMLEEPVEWKIEDGWIVEINGGVEAEHLKYVLDTYGNEDANAFAEFSIQTNPWARPNGNLIEHKDVGGAVHTATGTNASMGGPIEAGIHLDGVILEPTVEIDGETIVDEGSFRLEY